MRVIYVNLYYDKLFGLCTGSEHESYEKAFNNINHIDECVSETEKFVQTIRVDLDD